MTTEKKEPIKNILENLRQKFIAKTNMPSLHFISKLDDTQDKQASASSIRLVWFSSLAVILLLIWASLASVDQIARGMGQVVPSQKVQLMQNLEGGIVQEISVREGQIVEKDTVIMRIENELAGSQYREGLIRMLELEATMAMLETLLSADNNAQIQFSQKVLENQELMNRQLQLLASTRKQNEAEAQVLLLQSQTSLNKAEEQKEAKKQVQASMKLVEKQRDLALKALNADAFSELQYLDIEQKLQSLKAELAGLEYSIPRLEAEAQEAEQKLNLHKAELENRYRQELNEAKLKYLSLVELLSAGDDKVRRTEMRSPVRGIIKAIYAHTVGGVVAPGATVMEIVPLDDSLIIEAKFSPADIAFLYPGQKATVRLTAYDFSVYGGMEAIVDTISADTLQNQQGETFYKVKLLTKSAHLEHSGESLPIMAGMITEVDVLIGKKTIMDYLLKPLLKAQQRAFRER